ncbi:MAG TPA: hypothetical protein VEX68_11975 [Bryobacteraceae bacterium]|nr:hypothetical protein [Bryobacteraceae bacterium]
MLATIAGAIRHTYAVIILRPRPAYEESKPLGKALASALLDWPVWAHRKVESLSLLEGERARRHVSIDASPPLVPWPVNGDDSRRRFKHSEQVLVPLTRMAKGNMRDLDVVDDAGRPVPVLSRYENAYAATAALFVLVETQCLVRNPSQLWEQLFSVASGAPIEAKREAEALVKRLGLDETVSNLVVSLSENFLLCTLLPRAALKNRQVIKYSYHWERDPSDGFWGHVRTALAGLGFCSTRMAIEVTAADTVDSYHLEIPAPEGLVVTRLKLNSGASESKSQPSVVGHVQGNLADAEEAIASAYLRLQGRGLLTTVTLYALLSVGLLGALLSYPSALTAATTKPDAATAVLVLLPALLFGLAARGTENSIVSQLLVPLRLIAGLLSVAFAGFAGILIVATEQVAHSYVVGAFWAAALLALVLVAGRLTTLFGVRRKY